MSMFYISVLRPTLADPSITSISFPNHDYDLCEFINQQIISSGVVSSYSPLRVFPSYF